MNNIGKTKHIAAPQFTLNNVDGAPVSLETSVHDHRFTLLVFLRHLG